MKTQLYRHFDNSGRLLYVGVSLCAVARMMGHSRTGHWWEQIAQVTIESYSSRQAALEAEARAIKDERPLHNIVGRPDVRNAGLLTLNEANAMLGGGVLRHLRAAIESGALLQHTINGTKMLNALDVETWDARECRKAVLGAMGEDGKAPNRPITLVRGGHLKLPRLRRKGSAYYYDTQARQNRKWIPLGSNIEEVLAQYERLARSGANVEVQQE